VSFRCLASVLAAWSFAAAVLCALPARAETVVLAIGSAKSYDSSLPELRYADRDAERFADAMRRVGLVDESSTILLPAATRAAFWRAAFGLKSKPTAAPGRAGEPRKLIIYYSGHADEGALHLADGRLMRAELHELLASLPFDSKVVLLDSCYSGSLAAKGVAEDASFEIPTVSVDQPTGTVFLSASSGLERAYESEQIGAGVFTHYVLDGLFGGADGNQDGIVTVDELYQFVYAETRRFGAGLPQGAGQRPEFVADLKGRGALVMSFPTKAAGQVVLPPSLSGVVTFSQAHGVSEYPVEKSDGAEMTVRLPEGRYVMSVRKKDKAGRADVVVRPGAVARLSSGAIQWSAAPKTVSKGRGPSATVSAGATPPEMAFMLAGQSGTQAYMRPGPLAEAAVWKGLWRSSKSALALGLALGYRTNDLDVEGGQGVSQTATGAFAARLERSFGGQWVGLIAVSVGEAYHGQQRTYDESDPERFSANYPVAGAHLGVDRAVATGWYLGLSARRELHFQPERAVAAPATILGLSVRADLGRGD
jgi:hypothetical protein